jgi:hypothetical protein
MFECCALIIGRGVGAQEYTVPLQRGDSVRQAVDKAKKIQLKIESRLEESH